MIYIADISSTVANIAWMVNNLPLKIEATILYSGATDVVFTTPRVPGKVFKYKITDVASYSHALTVGDSWSGGIDLVNPIIIKPASSYRPASQLVIVSLTAFVILELSALSNQVCYTIIGSLTNADLFAVGVFRDVSTLAAQFIDISTSGVLKVADFVGIMTTADGHYYNSDYYCLNGLILLGSPMGIKNLMLPQLLLANFNTTVGDDVFIPGGWTNGASDYFHNNLLIVGGAV